MNKPLVSIIIPIYNSAQFLAETIASAMNQTWPNKEIILVDDGSTDESSLIAQSYACNWIRVFHQTNKGASAARNYGIRKAIGEYIQFLDADDLLSTNKIEEQVKLLLENPDKIAVCSTVHFFDGKDHISDGISENCDSFLYDTNDSVEFLINLYGGNGEGWMVQPNAWLTPKKNIEKAGLWNEKINVDDDGEFFCRVILQSDGIVYSSTAINYYRKFVKRRSLSATKNRKGMESALESTFLKHKYLSECSNNYRINIAFGRLYSELAAVFYPMYSDLSIKAIKKAKQLNNYKQIHYQHTSVYRIITFLFGWKFSAWINYIKNTIISS